MNPLINLINNSYYDIYFLVVDKNLDINVPELKNFYKIYLPDGETKNSGHLLSLESTQKFIKENSSKNQHSVAILPFKPSAKIEKICQKNGWLCLSDTSSLNRFLEDKIKFYEFCLQNKLPVIPSHIDTFNQENFEKYSKNNPPVIQSHFGWAGNSTFLAKNFNDLKDKIPLNTIVKFSPYIEGTTIINNCCFTRYGLIQSPPAIQLNNGFSTVGRSWPSDLSTEQLKQIFDITNDFAAAIAPLHYRGYFGLDFLVKDKEIYILECNPRLTASFDFYHQLEKKLKINSLFYFHILELLDINYSVNIETEQKRFCAQIKGKEITPRDNLNHIIEKIHEV